MLDIYLHTCIGVDYHTNMIWHWLNHYIHELHIHPDNVLVILQSLDKKSKKMLMALDFLEQHGVKPVMIWEGRYEAKERSRRTRCIIDERLPIDSWLIHCDSDELQEYPKDVKEFFNECDTKAINVVQGIYIDRVADGGILKSIDMEPSIWEQFPYECDIGNEIIKLPGNGVKMVAYRGDMRASKSQGTVDEDKKYRSKMRPYHGYLLNEKNLLRWGKRKRRNIDIKVHHFKWNNAVIKKLEDRVWYYKQLKYDWWGQSQNFLDYIMKNKVIEIRKYEFISNVESRYFHKRYKK